MKNYIKTRNYISSLRIQSKTNKLQFKQRQSIENYAFSIWSSQRPLFVKKDA